MRYNELHHMPPETEPISSSRAEKREKKKSIKKFRKKIRELGPGYDEISKIMTDDAVDMLRWGNIMISTRHSVEERKKELKKRIDKWIDSDPDAKNIKRHLKLRSILS